jgi:predicted double-glycine peptidase
MIQAWRSIDRRKRRWRGYKDEWNEGHWVAAIGYDKSAVYFEDPSLAVVRGFLAYDELVERWHDVGPYWIRPYKKRMRNYGIAIWKQPPRRPAYYRRAIHID